jgi:hypothetical protein
MLLLLAVAILAGAVWAGRKLRHRGGLPARLVTVAARRLPADRQEWADALIAESAAVRGSAARWAYAAAALRMAALPPPRRPQHVMRTAAVAITGIVVLSTVAVVAVPTLAPFLITLAALLALYLTVRAARLTPHTTTVAHRTVTSLALAGITAIVAVLCAVAIAHPSATTDRAHVLSTVLAAALTVYLAGAMHRPAAHANPIRYAAAAGALCLVGVTALNATTGPAPAGIAPMLPAAAIAICLAVAIGVTVVTGNAAAGRQAGLLTAVLAAPMQVAIVTIGLLTAQRWSLTGAYDRAAYRGSGYPDVASYMIGDALGGHIISGILIGPVIAAVIAAVAAPVGARLGRALHG